VNGAVRGLDLDLASARIPQPRHRGVLEEGGASLAREALVSGVPAIGIGDARVRLIEPVVFIAESPLRPAAHDLTTIEVLVRHTFRVHRGCVVGERDRRLPRGHVEAAGPRHDSHSRLRLDVGPARIGASR
jgi:hypothetical protein